MVYGAGGLRFESWASQIGHRVASGLPLLQHSLEGTVLPGRNNTEMGPINSLHASAYYSEYNERFELN